MQKNTEIKKTPIFLFSKEKPKGEMFSFYGGKESDEYKEKLEEGWVDTPAKLNLPKNLDTGVSIEDAENAKPQDLIKLVESYGFFVLTPEQLKAEAVKMANVAIDIENFSDEDLITEAERRGLKKSDEVEDAVVVDGLVDSGAGSAEDKVDPLALIDQFKLNNKKLSTEELIVVGKELGLSLRSNWSEKVMTDKINEKLNEA